MPTMTAPANPADQKSTTTMRALVFRGPNQIAIEQVPIPKPGPGEAVIRVTLTTICGTDLHILKGEYPVRPGLVIGHEPVGVIHELGVGVTGYAVGDRVLVGAITPWDNAAIASAATWPSAAGPSAAGNSATASTALRRNISWCRVHKRTWRKFPMI
jgi:NADPH:quinone reductase-like Zn-dependent oxidoreductase